MAFVNKYRMVIIAITDFFKSLKLQMKNQLKDLFHQNSRKTTSINQKRSRCIIFQAIKLTPCSIEGDQLNQCFIKHNLKNFSQYKVFKSSITFHTL